jgi:hypothetical protein
MKAGPRSHGRPMNRPRGLITSPHARAKRESGRDLTKLGRGFFEDTPSTMRRYARRDCLRHPCRGLRVRATVPRGGRHGRVSRKGWAWRFHHHRKRTRVSRPRGRSRAHRRS